MSSLAAEPFKWEELALRLIRENKVIHCCWRHRNDDDELEKIHINLELYQITIGNGSAIESRGDKLKLKIDCCDELKQTYQIKRTQHTNIK